jgi:hyperosmotically inducible protein
MKPCILSRFLTSAAILAVATVAGAADKVTPTQAETDAAVANSIRHEIIMYADYSIWDEVGIQVNNGNVHLTGAVVQPIKKEEIERLTRHVAGVNQLQDDIKVLPASFDDDRLRMRVARAIYGDPAFVYYANQSLKPIHILVENGHVTLAGVVNSELDKQLAGVRASTAGASFGPVINNLQVIPTPAKKS